MRWQTNSPGTAPRSPTTRASIIGIDLGKFKSVTCVSDSETTEATFATLPTNPEALRKALDRIRPDLVVFEACTVAGCLTDGWPGAKRRVPRCRRPFHPGHA